MPDIFKIVDLGVGLGSLVAIVFVVKIFADVMKNHMQHNTEAIRDLSVAIEQMLGFLERKN